VYPTAVAYTAFSGVGRKVRGVVAVLNKDQLYSIGQAAKLCDISIQTLRYYDKLNLIKPSETDKLTGYRYYSNLDMLHIKIVQDMKALNFSLEQVADALRKGSLARIHQMMREKHTETLRELERLEHVASSIAKRMEQMEELRVLGDGFKDIDVLIELRYIPDRNVAFDRRRAACGVDASVMRFTGLFNRIAAQGLAAAGYIMTVYHENIMLFDRNDSDLECCVPVSVNDELGDTSFIRLIPGQTYLTAQYCGIPNEDSCKRIYGKLLEWMYRNSYEECGPAIEQYLVDMTQMNKPEEFIVELQIPVRHVLTL
jgi:MerR family transcriptional activator of bmr gene